MVRLYHHLTVKDEVMVLPSKKKVGRSVSKARNAPKAVVKESRSITSYGIITGCSFIEARRLLEKKFDSEYLWLVRQSSYDDKVRVVSSRFEKKETG
jgi:hypothetical protein